MKSLNNGCPVLGFDVNSGWNWQPRYQGWSLIPIISTKLWISDLADISKPFFLSSETRTPFVSVTRQFSKLLHFLIKTFTSKASDLISFDKNLIDKIGFKEVKIMGSIGCKIASILRGESDIYICLSLPGQNSPKDWDFSAPEVILKAAGGAITNLDNNELSYGKIDFKQGGIIVATNNKKNHGSICLEIKKIIEDNGIYPL